MSGPIKILIIGNGFGGIYTLKNLHRFFHHDKRVKFSLVGEKNYFLFTPLLHEVATGGVNASNITEPIRKVLGCCLHEFYLGKAEFVSAADRTVKVGNHLILYDYLVLAPGAETNFYNIPGAEKYSLPLKSIKDAEKIKNHCITQVERASHAKDRNERKKMLRFVVVGGGPTGVELAAELEEFIKETFSNYYPPEIITDASIVLVQKDRELVPHFGPRVRQKSLRALEKKGVTVMLGNTVKEVGEAQVVLDKNIKISTETVIWVAGVKPAVLKFDGKIAQSSDGRLIVNRYLQLENHQNIFALGDFASFAQKNRGNVYTPLPALAQVAEKQARAVAKNIQLAVTGKALRAFRYRHTGNLISLGQWMAVGEILNFTFSGRVTWWFWRTVYLSKLISWRKKVRVAVDWTTNLFSPRDISEL
jgi:NADH dehydrogenase